MLEVKNLTKIYSGKGGVTVKALDDVSVVFPEKGMVFLLGKSGSGKSTLLNVAGGLDKPDGGEVIVKGKSSKDFSGSDFDSYRNTFIGFVFQEYNILNEFTIEQNIALALQLQSKPNDKKAVADLLEQVDLAGYAKRKPNTLSGGQKQRVAIARALIKEPEIIMADEPTGALDSNTGKQVLDTLKKLSENKLVIVVSHDREFAEYYGDRIIELKDGKIISDVSKVYNTPATLSGKALPEDEAAAQQENVALVSENTIAIRDAEALTDEEVKKIGQMLRGQKGEVIITADQKDMPGVKRACKINDNGNKESFKDTENIETKEYDGSKTKFIKSRLPLGHAIKMGASGLKSKPIRLIFTILLAVAAFVLFGVASTFMLYDPNYSVSEAMREANYPGATISKAYTTKITSYRVDNDGNKEYDYDWTNEISTRFGASEVQTRSTNGLDYAGVFNFTDNSYEHLDVGDIRIVTGMTYLTPTVSQNDQNYYVYSGAVGFSDCGAEYMTRQGFTLIAGAYPTAANEIALPSYLAELFLNEEEGGFASANNLIGKKAKFSFNAINDEEFTITGIYNVGTIPEKYAALKEGPGSPNRINDKDREKVQNSFKDYLANGFHLVVFVTPAFYDNYKDRISSSGGYSAYIQQENYKGIYLSDSEINWEVGDFSENQYSMYTDKTTRIYGENNFHFYDMQGNEATYDATKVYISKQRYNDFKNSVVSEYWWKVESRVKFVKGAEDAYNDETFQNKINYGKDNGATEKKAFIETWIGQIFNRALTFKMAQLLYNKGDASYQTGAFYTAYQAIQDYCYYNDSSADRPTDAMWTTLQNTVASDCTEAEMYSAAIDLLHDIGYWDVIFADRDDYDVANSLRNGTLSSSDYAAVKAEFNAYLNAKGYSALDTSTPFALLPSAFSLTNKKAIYYIDKNYNKGSVSVAGYFTITGTDWTSDYFVSESFMNSHAISIPFQGGYQIQVVESSYSVPTDAKYNYLVTLTDNSMGQITAMLFTEKDTVINIKSSVYEELQMFLELIDELEKIFLYVGLGVGLLAAFFLLNFISVSISTKRKDIGILRAVGARGSDVFKIFYAEAFIIALICFVLASVGSYVVCFFLNKTMVEAVSMKLLNFGLVNIGLVFGISLVVSVVATFFPVYFAARKSPVEAIRAL